MGPGCSGKRLQTMHLSIKKGRVVSSGESRSTNISLYWSCVSDLQDQSTINGIFPSCSGVALCTAARADTRTVSLQTKRKPHNHQVTFTWVSPALCLIPSLTLKISASRDDIFVLLFTQQPGNTAHSRHYIKSEANTGTGDKVSQKIKRELTLSIRRKPHGQIFRDSFLQPLLPCEKQGAERGMHPFGNSRGSLWGRSHSTENKKQAGTDEIYNTHPSQMGLRGGIYSSEWYLLPSHSVCSDWQLWLARPLCQHLQVWACSYVKGKGNRRGRGNLEGKCFFYFLPFSILFLSSAG